MSSLKILKSFRIPTNAQSFLLPFVQSRVPYLKKRSRSLWFRFQHHLLFCCWDLQLIKSHVAPCCGPQARVLSPLFFQAKSLLLPKPRGKREHPKATWSQLLPEPRGPKLLCQSCVVLPPISDFNNYQRT